MSIRAIVFSEVLIAFFIGSVPLLIYIKTNPSSDITTWVSALNPGDPLVRYFSYLLVLHILIWAINKYWLQVSRVGSGFIRVAHKFTHQIGFTIHSIYRAIAGAVPTAIIVLIIKHGFSEGVLLVSITSAILVIASIFMCSFLAWLSEKTAPKQKFL